MTKQRVRSALPTPCRTQCWCSANWSVQLASLQRKEIARKSLDSFGAIVVMDSYLQSTQWINEIAPEHLEIFASIPMSAIDKVRNAGSIFYGDYSPEAVGDYFAGAQPCSSYQRNGALLLAAGCLSFSAQDRYHPVYERMSWPAPGNRSMRWLAQKVWMLTRNR